MLLSQNNVNINLKINFNIFKPRKEKTKIYDYQSTALLEYNI